jgi:hypothetical protein
MYRYIVENIISRYSENELSQKYNVDLPTQKGNEELVNNSDFSNKMDGHYYEINNDTKFRKEKGGRAHATILQNDDGICFEYRLSWFEKLLNKIKGFFDSIKNKIQNFIDNLVSKVPQNLRTVLKFFLGLVLIPFILLGVITTSLKTITKMPGGILGMIIGAFITLFIILPIKISIEIISYLLSPLVNKFADSMMHKPFIKNMVIGRIVNNANYLKEGKVVISKSMVSDISFQEFKTLTGKQNLYVIITEGNQSISMVEKVILTRLFPD